MFSMVFVKTIKRLIRNKTMIFWTLIFSMVMAVLLTVALSALRHQDFEKSKIAVVYSVQDAAFEGALSEAAELFEVTECGKDEADDLLKKDKTDAVIEVTADGFVLNVTKNGVAQSIAKSFLDGYISVRASVEGIMGSGGTDIASIIAELKKSVAPENQNEKQADMAIPYYYALIAMMCFYYSFLGQNVVESTQPEQNLECKRLSASGCPRLKLFGATFLAHMAISTVMLLLSLGFMSLIGIRLGAFGPSLLTCLVGMICGLGFGMVITAAAGGKNTGLKIGLQIGLTMTMCVFAGLVSSYVKLAVLSAAPLMRFFNPLGLISDCLFALYYYDTLSVFWQYLGILSAYAAAFVLVSGLIIFLRNRRSKGRASV